MNPFVGRPARYLGLGGGMKMDLVYTDRKHRTYGMLMSIYGNHLREQYQLATVREQHKIPPTILLGLVYGHWWKEWLLQGQLAYAQQNVTPSLDDRDRDWIAFRGAALGVVAHRSIPLGKGNPDYYYGRPVVNAGAINLHAGIYYLQYRVAEASGLMLEVGLGYRLSTFGVERYKLKP